MANTVNDEKLLFGYRPLPYVRVHPNVLHSHDPRYHHITLRHVETVTHAQLSCVESFQQGRIHSFSPSPSSLPGYLHLSSANLPAWRPDLHRSLRITDGC